MAEKKTRGRQRIPMRRIENDDDRIITFSKRRSGIYKKASELATLTGAEVAFVVFSPSGKPFSFGHPSVESVANRFLWGNQPPNDSTHPLVEAHRQVRIDELNQVHNELIRQLDEEKERGKVLKQMSKEKEKEGHRWWWETPVEELNMQELLQMNAAFDEIHRNAVAKLNEKTAAAAAAAARASSSSMAQAPFNIPEQAANQFAANQQLFDPSGAYPFPFEFNQGRF